MSEELTDKLPKNGNDDSKILTAIENLETHVTKWIIGFRALKRRSMRDFTIRDQSGTRLLLTSVSYSPARNGLKIARTGLKKVKDVLKTVNRQYTWT